MPKGKRPRTRTRARPYKGREKKEIWDYGELHPELWTNLPRDILIVIAEFFSGKSLFKFFNISRFTRSEVAKSHMDRFIVERIAEIKRRMVYRDGRDLIYKGEKIYQKDNEINPREARAEIATYFLFRDMMNLLTSPYRNPHLLASVSSYLWRFYPHFISKNSFHHLTSSIVDQLSGQDRGRDKYQRDELYTHIILRCCTEKTIRDDLITYNPFWPYHSSPLWELLMSIRPNQGDPVYDTPHMGNKDRAAYLWVQGAYLRIRTSSARIPIPHRFLSGLDLYVNSAIPSIGFEYYAPIDRVKGVKLVELKEIN